MKSVEQLSKRQFVHDRMVPLLFLINPVVVLFLVQDFPVGIRLLRLPDEVPEVESLLLTFEQRKDTLLAWSRLHLDASAKYNKYGIGYYEQDCAYLREIILSCLS